MAIIRAVLDTNIYDLLEAGPIELALLQCLVSSGQIKILMPRTVGEELYRRPQGFPQHFKVTVVGHHVARAGLMCAGDALGEGRIFDAHRGDGTAKHIPDALIADTAATIADWFVSNDGRSRKRLARQTLGTNCRALTYAEFVAEIAGFSQTNAR